MCGHRQGCGGLIYLSDLQEMKTPQKYISASGGEQSTTSVSSINDKIAAIILVTDPLKASESGSFNYKVVSNCCNDCCTPFNSFKFNIKKNKHQIEI